MLEKELEKILVKEIKKAGGRAYKFISPGNDGVPDRLVVLPGRAPVFVELKTEKGRLSRLQRVQLAFLQDCSQDVHVVYGVSGLKALFYQMGLNDAYERMNRNYGN